MRSVLGYSIVAATILGIFVGNGAFADDTPARPPKCDPFKVAERYLAEHFHRPGSDEKPVLRRSNDSWQVEYELPPGYIGGTPTVTISKATCEVTKVYLTQ
jgi:hypothetical protein